MSASAIIILQKSSRIAELLEDRVGVKGTTLDVRLARAGMALPREARAAARRIATAERKARAGGVIEVDAQGFDDDYRLCLRHINGLHPAAVRRGLWLTVLQTGATAMMSGAILGLALVYAGMI